MLSKWKQHNPVLFLLLFWARNESRLNFAVRAGQVNWLQTEPGWGGLPRCWGGRWQRGPWWGHPQGPGQLKGHRWRDTGHCPAGAACRLRPGRHSGTRCYTRRKPERTCSCASQEVLFRSLRLGLRKRSMSCAFKIVLGGCLRWLWRQMLSCECVGLVIGTLLHTRFKR